MHYFDEVCLDCGILAMKLDETKKTEFDDVLSTICLSTSLDNDIDANQSGTELTFDYQWKFALQHIDDVCPSQNGLGVFLPGPGPG